MKILTAQNYDLSFSPATQKNLKDSQRGLRTLTEIRDCKSRYQLYGACLDAKKKIFNHLDSNLRRVNELGEETKSRRVYDNDIRMLFQMLPRYEGVRKKMATWKNIKAPKEVEKLPLYHEIRRLIRILIIRNRDRRELAIMHFNPAFRNMQMPRKAEIFLAVLGFYAFDMLKREDLLFVYKDKLMELFKREYCHLDFVGYKEFVKETKEMYPDSFYMDGYAHYKCFDKSKNSVEKTKAAKEERENAKYKIILDVIKMAINPNVIHKYFKETGGNTQKLLDEINERFGKKGFKSISQKTLDRYKSKIFKEYGINIKELLKADKSLYKEHTAVRKEFTKKRMTMKERVDIIRFVLQGKDPSEMDVIAYYSQHLPPWQRMDTWSIPIDNLYPS